MQEFLCNVVLPVCFGVASSAGLFCLSRDQGGGGLGVPGCLEWLAGYLWWRTARGGLISVFEEFSAIVDKAFVLAGGLGDELSFIGVQEIS